MKQYEKRIIVILIVLGFVSGMACGYIRVSNNSFDLNTKITNSNGKYWNATGANLKLAIKDCANVSGTVFLPTGTITGCNDVYLWSNVSIKGSGMYNTILKADGACSYGVIYIPEGNDNFSVSDLTIDANAASIAGANGIMARRIKDFTFQNIYIHDCDSNGLFIQTELPDTAAGNSANGIIDNIRADKCGITATTCEPFAFNNVSRTSFSNLQTTQSYSSGSWGADFHALKNCTVNGVIVKGSRYGIKIFGEGTYYSADNTFSNLVATNISDTGECLWIKKSYRDKISNVVTMDGINGVYIDTSYYTEISNINSVSALNVGLYTTVSSHIGVTLADVRQSGSGGLYISGSNNVTIVKLTVIQPGNYNFIGTSKFIKILGSNFDGGTSYGLDIDACSYVKIDTSSFYKNTEDGITTEIGGCHNYTISFCDFSGNDKALDLKSTDQYFLVSNCICPSGDAIDVNAALSNTRRVNDTIVASLVVT